MAAARENKLNLSISCSACAASGVSDGREATRIKEKLFVVEIGLKNSQSQTFAQDLNLSWQIDFTHVFVCV